MRLTQILHLLNEVGRVTIHHVFSLSLTQIASIEIRICHPPAVAHIATKYYLVADMARDGEINVS